MKPSLWDLKPTSPLIRSIWIWHHETIPMGFETMLKPILRDDTGKHHETIPMGFETASKRHLKAAVHDIMKPSLWDLKLKKRITPVTGMSLSWNHPYGIWNRPLFLVSVFSSNHETIPMGFETQGDWNFCKCAGYHETIPMGFETWKRFWQWRRNWSWNHPYGIWNYWRNTL